MSKSIADRNIKKEEQELKKMPKGVKILTVKLCKGKRHKRVTATDYTVKEFTQFPRVRYKTYILKNIRLLPNNHFGFIDTGIVYSMAPGVKSTTVGKRDFYSLDTDDNKRVVILSLYAIYITRNHRYNELPSKIPANVSYMKIDESKGLEQSNLIAIDSEGYRRKSKLHPAKLKKEALSSDKLNPAIVDRIFRDFYNRKSISTIIDGIHVRFDIDITKEKIIEILNEDTYSRERETFMKEMNISHRELLLRKRPNTSSEIDELLHKFVEEWSSSEVSVGGNDQLLSLSNKFFKFAEGDRKEEFDEAVDRYVDQYPGYGVIKILKTPLRNFFMFLDVFAFELLTDLYMKKMSLDKVADKYDVSKIHISCNYMSGEKKTFVSTVLLLLIWSNEYSSNIIRSAEIDYLEEKIQDPLSFSTEVKEYIMNQIDIYRHRVATKTSPREDFYSMKNKILIPREEVASMIVTNDTPEDGVTFTVSKDSSGDVLIKIHNKGGK